MKIAETDETHHDVIYKGTGNDRLVQILNNLREQDVGSLPSGIHQGRG